MNERYFAEKQDGVNTIHAEDFNLAFGDIADDMATLEAEAAASNAHIKNESNPHSVTKEQVGLSNVDNTKDADKPVSTATQAALDLKANAADVYTKTEADALVLGKLAVKGDVNTFSNLPNNAANGDVYRINAGAVYSNDNVSNLLTGNFGTYFHDYSGDGSGYNFTNGLDNVPGLINYFQLGMIGDEYAYYTAIYDGDGNYVCDVYQNADTGPDKKDLAPIMTGDDTVAFYISPFYNVQFYTVGELGLVYMRGGNWYPMADAGWIKREFGDIESALDGILSIQNALIGGGSE